VVSQFYNSSFFPIYPNTLETRGIKGTKLRSVKNQARLKEIGNRWPNKRAGELARELLGGSREPSIGRK
jgi:hypothetical protein